MRTYIYLLLLVFTCCLVSCHSKKQSANENESVNVQLDTIEIKPIENVEEYAVDDVYVDEGPIYPDIIPLPTKMPADIPAYFKNLEVKELAAPYHRDLMGNEDEQIQMTLRELQRYATGKRKYYPAEDVQTAISHLSQYAHYASGHSDDHTELRMVNNYRNHFIAIAAMLSPNMDFLQPVKDANATIGLRQFCDWSQSYTIQSYVFLPNGKNLFAESMDDLNAVMATKIFRLTDEKGRLYYLFSNDDNIYKFGQVLCMMDKGELKYVTRLTDLSSQLAEEGIILFYPNTKVWHFCEENEGCLERIPDAPTIHLKLDGMESKFYLTISHRN